MNELRAQAVQVTQAYNCRRSADDGTIEGKRDEERQRVREI